MNDQDSMILWLQKEIGKDKLVMHEIINIYDDINTILEKNNMSFKYDFNINLIKLCKFIYLNSKTYT
jgi:hypothetical protein